MRPHAKKRPRQKLADHLDHGRAPGDEGDAQIAPEQVEQEVQVLGDQGFIQVDGKEGCRQVLRFVVRDAVLGDQVVDVHFDRACRHQADEEKDKARHKKHFKQGVEDASKGVVSPQAGQRNRPAGRFSDGSHRIPPPEREKSGRLDNFLNRDMSVGKMNSLHGSLSLLRNWRIFLLGAISVFWTR